MAKKSRNESLKGLKMPGTMADKEVEMDLEMEEGLEEMPEEEMEMAEGDEMLEEGAGMLDDYSDDELLEEMQKRGLMAAEDMDMEEGELEDEDMEMDEDLEV